jgi:tetratricopeptide (TPR) repeat protein
LDRLAGHLAGCFDGSAGRAVFIEGPAGVGKTTLVTALVERVLAARPDVAIARGRCVQSFESGEPYLPFIDALRDLSDETETGLVSRKTVRDLLKELAPYWLQVVPLVGNLLSATFATAAEVGRMRKGNAPSREALFVQYLELLSRLTKQSPILLFLDDLHWADHASLALLAYLTRGVARLPVAIVGTLRNLTIEQEDPAIGQTLLELEREGLATRVALAELDGNALDALMREEFEGEVSDPLLRWIRKTAGGNPLFATELARLLRSTGGAALTHGEWRLTESGAQTEVPRSAEAVIEKRLQRLAPDALNLLQYASIDGSEFDSMVLSRLLGKDELDVLDALDPLERTHGLIESIGDMILPGGDTASAYRFHHVLVHTVLYRQVVGKRRILLHRKAGEVLEGLWGEGADSVAGRLARHYHEGRVADRAYRFARTAAESAAAVFANWEAIDLLELARKNAADFEAHAWVAERMGDVYGTVGHYAVGVDCYRSLFDNRNATDQLRLNRKVTALERKGGLSPAPELAQRVRALLDTVDVPPAERCLLLLELTRLPGMRDTALRAAEALAIAETLGDPILLADALERLAVARLFAEGNGDHGFDLLERALHIAESINDPVLLARYHSIAGVARAKAGRYSDAQRDFEDALKAFERMGDPNGVGAVCTNLGVVMLRFGLYDEAESMLDRARAIHERRDRSSAVESLFGLAERARLAGDADRAIQRYQQLLRYAEELKHWNSEAVAWAGIGLCRLERGELDAAAQASAAVSAALAGRDQWFEDRDLIELFLARLDAAQHRVSDALDRLQRTAETLRSRDIYLWARVELERGRLLWQTDPVQAAAVLERVAAETAGIQSPPIQTETSKLRALLAA